MRSRREEAKEPGPLRPAARHLISQPLPAGSHGSATYSMIHAHVHMSYQPSTPTAQWCFIER